MFQKQSHFKGLLCVAFLLNATLLSAQQAKINVSPEVGEIRFSVTFHGKEVVSQSSLGFNIDHRLLGKDAKVVLMENGQKGCKTYVVEGQEGEVFYLDTREFDDGVALRYRIPADGPRCIYDEHTTFRFPNNTRVWYASGPFQYGWNQIYQERTVDKIKGELLAPPSTFLLPDGTYAALTEANLTNFHGAVMFGIGNNQVKFGYVENEGHLKTGTSTGMPQYQYAHSVVKDVPWIVSPKEGEKEIVTPWRILMLADNLNNLVNNRIISQVADVPDPSLFPQGKETEWIKPGRSVFLWLVAGGSKRLTVDNHKRYIDGAAELGLESVVVDDGWELWNKTEPNANSRSKWDFLKEVVDYGKERNVDVWVWRPSSPRFGNKGDIGLLTPEERKSFMGKCAEIGVKGLKVDFFCTENLFTVGLMEEILKEAARHQLMVVFHGVNKPTGDSFTYPNLLAKEAVRGLECVGAENSWAPGPAWPYHNTILPFTRWLAGPADYTPLHFRKNCPESVTFTHQLASIYMFTSPMLILAADMDDMLQCPGRSFIEEVPVTWDETHVLSESSIGEVAAIARRKGNVWYLSVLNGEKEATVNFNLDFLPKGRYRMTAAFDANNNRKKIEIKQETIHSKKPLKVDLYLGGGFLAKFEKK